MGAFCPAARDIEDLKLALAYVFSGPVAIVDRSPNWWASTFPSEVITCRLSSGKEYRLLCKFGSESGTRLAFGHRRGVAYEAAVYACVLQHLPLSSPRFFGTYTPAD